jgi:hypothetical protein
MEFDDPFMPKPFTIRHYDAKDYFRTPESFGFGRCYGEQSFNFASGTSPYTSIHSDQSSGIQPFSLEPHFDDHH